MRRSLPLLLATLVAASGLHAPPVAAEQGGVGQGGPPHSWLFGSWTGGMFPVPSNLTAQACFSQPTVIFTRDAVLRATLTEVTFSQRVVETARTSAGATEFQFAPVVDLLAGGTGLLAAGAPNPEIGFGCEGTNVLHVAHRTDNQVVFPGCGDFPYPLVRCSGLK